METVIQGSTLQTLRAGLRGAAHAPGEEGYGEASRAWNLAAHQQPALVVVARGAADVLAAVRFARDGGLGVGVMATGHGVGTACDGGVLINTSNMRGVRVDPVDRTARVEAGALWIDLIHESQVHGLAAHARGARRADHGHLRDDAVRGDGLYKHGPGRPDGDPPALRDAE